MIRQIYSAVTCFSLTIPVWGFASPQDPDSPRHPPLTRSASEPDLSPAMERRRLLRDELDARPTQSQQNFRPISMRSGMAVSVSDQQALLNQRRGQFLNSIHNDIEQLVTWLENNNTPDEKQIVPLFIRQALPPCELHGIGFSNADDQETLSRKFALLGLKIKDYRNEEVDEGWKSYTEAGSYVIAATKLISTMKQVDLPELLLDSAISIGQYYSWAGYNFPAEVTRQYYNQKSVQWLLCARSIYEQNKIDGDYIEDKINSELQKVLQRIKNTQRII